MKLQYDCMNILQNSTAYWVRYGLGLCEIDEVLNDDRVQMLIAEAKQKDEVLLKRHNDAKHPMHKTALLADFGMTKDCEDIAQIAENIMSNQSEDGAFLSLQNIPTNFGGTDTDEYDWVICDFPTYLYSLIKFGYKDDERVIRAIKLLESLAEDNGFRCRSSMEKFGGPGKKGDFCPYSNLLALKVFSLLGEYHDEEFVKNAIDALFEMWRVQGDKKFRMFGIGTDFRKLKFPNVWFNVVHVVSVLCKYDYAKKSPEFEEMLQVIFDKQLESGGFIPESIYMNFKPYDFGQKKVESDTLTYAIYKVFEEL